jgi:hypothetical protein
VVALALALTTGAFAADLKIAEDFKCVAAESQVDVIVQFTRTPTERHHSLITRRGGALKDDLSIAKAGHYVMPASALADHRFFSEVSRNWAGEPLDRLEHGIMRCRRSGTSQQPHH